MLEPVRTLFALATKAVAAKEQIKMSHLQRPRLETQADRFSEEVDLRLTEVIENYYCREHDASFFVFQYEKNSDSVFGVRFQGDFYVGGFSLCSMKQLEQHGYLRNTGWDSMSFYEFLAITLRILFERQEGGDGFTKCEQHDEENSGTK